MFLKIVQSNIKKKNGGDSFQYWIHNTDKIKYFDLNVYDQDMRLINDLPDYYLHVQFNIREKLQNNELLENLKKEYKIYKK